MDILSFFYEKTCLIKHDELAIIGKQLESEIKRIQAARDKGYDSIYASINLPFDTALREQVIQMVMKKQKHKPSVLVVIGIGGSNLGTMAVHEALYGAFYNEQKPDTKVYYADTVDSDYILDIALLIEQELQSGREVLLNVISKSGTTAETIANFEIFLDILRRSRPQNYHEFVVVTTDEGSPLWKVAGAEGFDRLLIPKNVGGRYSVFSAVSLFPLKFIGVDIELLNAGAQEMVDKCISNDFFANPAALTAALLYGNYKKGFTIHDMFLFSVDLYLLGMWYRQLLAESIGKEHDRAGKRVTVGITPTVSIGSTDLHSIAQLHLGGPNNRFTTFVSIEKNKSNIPVPCLEKFEQLVAHIQCRPLSSIMNAILQGTKRAYEEKKRPFNTVVIPEKNAWCVGQFLQWNMISIMYLGYLLGINPFDQPEVELYKQETRKILAHE
ncbi:hypothetical protein E3J79_02930 [Candidatus Dependentiae bacterium]|nr:MAG: hypothetical protein E3J79_02930 [Candidatus Dependentiae bacterium]